LSQARRDPGRSCIAQLPSGRAHRIVHVVHTASQLDSSMFSIEAGGSPASREDVFPGWDVNDRVGVICSEPFGALGASHLLQLSITAFFDARPERRNGSAQYPEIHLFHLGERHGDHSYYDFWPPRKEVVVDNDADAILTAVNAHGITWLVVVDGAPVPTEHREAEQEPALDRIRGAFAYHPSGRVADADLLITGLDPQTEQNATLTLDADLALATQAASPPRSPESGRWRTRFTQRATEIASDARAQAAATRRALLEDGCASESYRRIPVAQALEMLTVAPASTGRAPDLAASRA
jgi:hypothetical protein